MVLGVITVIYVVSLHNISKYQYPLLTSVSKLKNQIPAGEIVKGFMLTQSFSLDKSVLYKIQHYDLNSVACVGILMANYSNRKNSGYIEIGLFDGLKTVYKQVDVANVADNIKRMVCFDNKLYLSDLHVGDYELSIKGVSSVSNEAVTVWLTKNIAHREVNINGKPKPYGLMFSLHFQKKHDNFVFYILFITYVISILLFVVLFLVSGKQNEDKQQSGEIYEIK